MSFYWQSVGTLNQLGSMDAARNGIQRLQRTSWTPRPGQRGYLLTGRPEHLAPYHQALRDIEAQFSALDQYYAGDPEPSAALDKLHTLTAAKLSQLAQTIRVRDAPHREPAAEIALSDIGREQMTAIRTVTDELQRFEEQRVVVGHSDLYKTLRRGRIGVAALTALSLLALSLFLRQTAALKRQQRTLKQIVQAERDRLEGEVRRRIAQLTELAHPLQTVREDERSRLARNLHDELGALLTSVKLDAARIRSRLAGASPEALERLAHLVSTLNRSIALGRGVIEDLRPSTLSNLGLVPTLEILAREYAEQSGVEVDCDLTPVRLGATTELTVYRLVQEAITNISKYAGARHVGLTLAVREGLVTVSVRDDGAGFDPATLPASAHALVGMRFRVEAEGGTLRVESAPGRGTCLTLILPESGTHHDPDVP